jgi:peptidoglycan hydrolase-like protein with peptidoglycan-binding domain
MHDYDARAARAVAALDGGDELASTLVGLIGSGSPRLVAAVHRAEAKLETGLLAKSGFKPTEARDPSGLWTTSGGSSGGKPQKPKTIARGDGMSGPPDARVRLLQGLLDRLGLDLGKPGVDGRFGPITERAVKTLQKRNGLKADGVVGPDTLALLKRLAGKHPKKPTKPKPDKPKPPAGRQFTSSA